MITKEMIDELLHTVGKVLLDEGEAWRLAHPELLDVYQACTEAEEINECR